MVLNTSEFFYNELKRYDKVQSLVSTFQRIINRRELVNYKTK